MDLSSPKTRVAAYVSGISFAVAVAVALLAPGSSLAATSVFANGFAEISGLATDSSGNVFVLERNKGRVTELNSAGQIVRAWGQPAPTTNPPNYDFAGPSGLAVAPNGHVFVSDTNNFRVQEFTNDGQFVRTYSVLGPWGIAADSAGNVWVASGADIKRLDPATGTVNDGWTVAASPWAFNLAAGSDGSLYVADGGNYVRRYSPDGTLLSSWGGPRTDSAAPTISARADTVYVNTSPAEARTAAGQLLSTYPLPSSNYGGLAETEAGALLVAAGTTVFQVVPGEPDPAIKLSTGLALTDDVVTADASTSNAPFATIDDYAWDLDDDGTFETDTGQVPSIQLTFGATGMHSVRVRVRASNGKSATAQARIEVRPRPPAGPVGVSVNNGALYTNTRAVRLSTTWPAFALTATVSNDGGFANAQRMPVMPFLAWTLDSAGPERLPKSVYVRFDDSIQTFQDDIILDEVPPAVASAIVDTSPSVSAAATAVRRLHVSVSARDDNSGVASMQFALDQKKPLAPRPYAATATLTSVSPPRFVRVRDRAGNFSAWRKVLIQDVALARKSIRLGTGAQITYTVPAARSMTVKIVRSRRVVKKVEFELPSGNGALRLPTKRLSRGRYTLIISIRKSAWTLPLRIA